MTQDTKSLSNQYQLHESKTFCMAPWIHMHVWPNGRAFPCCLAEHNDGNDYGNTNTHTLEQLWNSDLAKTLRTNMLNDKPTSACTRCYELESDSNAYTLRKNMNNRFAHHFWRTHDTKEDGTYDGINLTYMDFRFSNLCNMSCRSCSPTFSTQWYDDFIKEFGSVPKDIAEQKFIQLKNKKGFEQELWPYLDTVEEVYWAGGEPLITDMHWKIMNHWVETGHAQNVSVLYTTNFSQLTYKNQHVFDLWKQFKQVKVSASLDAMGTHGEYIRKGTIWSDIEANRQAMLDDPELAHVEFDICPTLSLMNVLHFPDFHEEWVNKGFIPPGEVRLNNLLDPKFLSMQALPNDYKLKVTKRWEKHLEWLSIREDFVPDHWPASQYIDSAKGLLNFMNTTDRTSELASTIKEFERWDKWRDESWLEVLPELACIGEYREQ